MISWLFIIYSCIAYTSTAYYNVYIYVRILFFANPVNNTKSTGFFDPSFYWYFGGYFFYALAVYSTFGSVLVFCLTRGFSS